jgi:hypothetical protein
MRRKLALSVAAGVLVLGLLAGTTAAFAGPNLTAPITIKVFTKLIHQSSTGTGQGDTLTVNDNLTQNGNIVGSDAQVCTWSNTSKKQMQCVWTLSLFARGQVVLAGLINFNKATNTLAVTGGTQSLSNARGYATVLHFSQKTVTVTLHLTP